MAEKITPTEDEKILPLAEEELEVAKRLTSTTVRAEKRVATEIRDVEVPLQSARVEIERVPVGRFVDGPIPERWEGDTLVVSVVEEVPVVAVKFRLVEEVRMTRRTEERTELLTVPLRRETVEIKRQGT